MVYLHEGTAAERGTRPTDGRVRLMGGCGGRPATLRPRHQCPKADQVVRGGREGHGPNPRARLPGVAASGVAPASSATRRPARSASAAAGSRRSRDAAWFGHRSRCTDASRRRAASALRADSPHEAAHIVILVRAHGAASPAGQEHLRRVPFRSAGRRRDTGIGDKPVAIVEQHMAQVAQDRADVALANSWASGSVVERWVRFERRSP